MLQDEGVSVDFINLRWAKPLDADTILDAARRTAPTDRDGRGRR